MEATGSLEVRLDELLERLSAGAPGPGGGSAAALTVTVAAGLVSMVARNSLESWPEAESAAAQARELQAQVSPLAQADADAWLAALEALRGEGGSDVERRLGRAAEVPLQIAEAAADVAELAARTAERGDGTYRGDAVAAALLAQSAARVGAHLVEINLATRPGDERLRRAYGSEERATAAVARALRSGQ